MWRNVNHWVILAAALTLVGVAAMAWMLMLRRRQRTWLYQYRHATLPGRAYIGITNDPDVRYAREQKAWWFPHTTGRMELVCRYRSRELADAAEAAAIEEAALAGEPLLNDRKVPQHIRQARIRQHASRGLDYV